MLSFHRCHLGHEEMIWTGLRERKCATSSSGGSWKVNPGLQTPSPKALYSSGWDVSRFIQGPWATHPLPAPPLQTRLRPLQAVWTLTAPLQILERGTLILEPLLTPPAASS